MSNAERGDSPFTSELVYCQVCSGPSGKGGNEETSGIEQGWVYIWPAGVSLMTPSAQAPRVRVGLENQQGPVGSRNDNHRLSYNGARMVCNRDAGGRYSNPQFYPSFTGPEIQGRGGVTGKQTSFHGVLPEKA